MLRPASRRPLRTVAWPKAAPRSLPCSYCVLPPHLEVVQGVAEVEGGIFHAVQRAVAAAHHVVAHKVPQRGLGVVRSKAESISRTGGQLPTGVAGRQVSAERLPH